MQRFLLEDIKFSSEIMIDDDVLLHQFFSVLRYKIGDQVIFFDGRNSADYVYEITEIKPKKYVKLLGKNIINKFGQDKYISLYQAIPNKLEKLEYIIQKGVEVGISKFCFFRSERSQKLTLSEAKKERLQKICEEAVEQSGRNLVPSIVFSEKLDKVDGEVLFFDPSADDSHHLHTFTEMKNIALLVGPEGGWSEREIHQYIHFGYKKVSLGDFILRTETVGVVVTFFLHQSL